MSKPVPWLRRWAVIAVGLLVVAMVIHRCLPSRVQLEADRPECPQSGEYSKLFRQWFIREAGGGRDTSLALIKKSVFTNMPISPPLDGSPSLIGDKTDIVEYHDCQELVVNRPTGLGYSGLFAVLARESLDTTYFVPHADSNSTGVFDDSTMGIPMGLVFSYDSAYTPLNIDRGFNCIYFFRDAVSGWVAKIKPVAGNPDACTIPMQATAKKVGPIFVVSRTVRDDLRPQDYPPVARWDWDRANSLQYIGIRCEAAWCEIHPQNSLGQFESSPPIYENGNLARPLIKGWYDRQLLAEPSPTGPVVTSIMGTIVPDAGIDTVTNATSYKNHWVRQATVGIDNASTAYRAKFNFVKDVGGVQQNELSLCHNVPSPGLSGCESLAYTGTPCVDQWFMKITHGGSATGTISKFFCVIRRDHATMPAKAPATGMVVTPHIPGTSRWRWLLADDTMWSRCVQGCCEVRS